LSNGNELEVHPDFLANKSGRIFNKMMRGLLTTKSDLSFRPEFCATGPWPTDDLCPDRNDNPANMALAQNVEN